MKRAICLLVLFSAVLVVFSGCKKRNLPAIISKEPQQNTADENLDVLEENNDLEEIEPEETSSDESDSQPQEPLTKTLVVPEGYTLARIGMRLEEMDVCTAEEFIAATEEGDFSAYPLVAEQPYNPDRAFKLEGYLFPDTYEIYSDETPAAIIEKMLANLESKISSDMREHIASSGFTVDEILILASIIEKEAYERSDVPVPEEMPRISSVLHNRLAQSMRLQCDVTITYVTGVLGHFKEDGVERYKHHYNTYRTDALPAGAICNPGMDAINAAAYPAQTDYLFFLTDEDKNFYYSSTYEEHLVLIEKYLSDDK